MGWLPDYPDFRDLTMDDDKVSVKLKALGQLPSLLLLRETLSCIARVVLFPFLHLRICFSTYTLGSIFFNLAPYILW